MRSPRWHWWALVGLLLVGVALRAHNITALPPFNDESHHIRRAEEIYSFTNRDLNLTLGKLLSYYWIGAFDAARLDAIFIGRTVTALFAMIGLAGVYATAKLLFGHKAGAISLVLATFSPFMLFFDRLALTDSLTAAVSMVLLGASVKLLRGNHNRWGDRWAIWVGVLCGLAVIGKLLAVPLVAVPCVAVLVWGKPPVALPRFKGWWHLVWRTYRPMLGTVYAVLGVMMLPFVWHLFDRAVLNQQLVPVVNNDLINGAAEQKSPLQVIVDNFGTLWETHWLLHSPLLVVVMLAAVAWVGIQRDRRGIYLLLCIGLAWSLSLFVAAKLSTRYLTLGVLPAFVVVGGMLASGEWPRSVQKYQAWVASGLMVLWLGSFALPFINHAWTDPTRLNLPKRDQWEYYENFSAGYGLVAAAADMEQLTPAEPSGRVRVLGLVGSCHQLRLYLDEDGIVWLECPFFGWQGEYMGEVARTVDERLATESVVYLLVEPELPYTDLSQLHVRWELIERYPRPFDGMTVELYRVYALDEQE